MDRAVALAGTLIVEHAYGPPGYGEDKRKDVPVSYWALKLSFEVTTACTAQLPELWSIQCGPAHTLRLYFPTNSEGKGLLERARPLQGHRVLVTGIVQRRSAMADYTPIYMNVADISEVKDREQPAPAKQ